MLSGTLADGKRPQVGGHSLRDKYGGLLENAGKSLRCVEFLATFVELDIVRAEIDRRIIAYGH